MDLEGVVAVGEPACCDGLHLRRRWRQRRAVVAPCRSRAGRQRPRPAASTSDLPPKPPIRSMPRMKPARVRVLTRCQLRRRRTAGEEACELFVDRLFDPGQSPSPGRALARDGEEPADLLLARPRRQRRWRSDRCRRGACTVGTTCRRSGPRLPDSRCRRRRRPSRGTFHTL